MNAEAAGGEPFDLVLRNCRLENRPGPADIAISSGLIAQAGGRVDGECRAELDVEGRLVSSAFVQPHIHLDKVGTLPLLDRNRTGTLAEAIDILHQTKRSASPDEVAARAGVVIRQAVVSGTTRIRSHVDVDTIGGLAPLRGVLQAAREHAGLCEVQTVIFPQEGIIRDPGTAELMDAAMREGGDLVGGMPHWETSEQAAREHIGICMRLAQRYDTDVDMHIDETDDPDSKTLAIGTRMARIATAEPGLWGLHAICTRSPLLLHPREYRCCDRERSPQGGRGCADAERECQRDRALLRDPGRGAARPADHGGDGGRGPF